MVACKIRQRQAKGRHLKTVFALQEINKMALPHGGLASETKARSVWVFGGTAEEVAEKFFFGLHLDLSGYSQH